MPIVLNSKTNKASKLFSIKSVQLKFGKLKRTHEVIIPTGKRSVSIVAISPDKKVYLIKEYCTAFHRYEWSIPKGVIDKGETGQEAARRECQEEIGMKPAKLTKLAETTSAPGYVEHTNEIYLASNLTPSKLEGDEPEALIIRKATWREIHNLIKEKKMSHEGTIAALLLAEKKLKK